MTDAILPPKVSFPLQFSDCPMTIADALLTLKEFTQEMDKLGEQPPEMSGEI